MVVTRFNLGGPFALRSDEFLYDDVAVHRIHEIRYSKFATMRAAVLAFVITAFFAGLLVVTRHQNSDPQIWRMRANAIVIVAIFLATTIKYVRIYIHRNYADPVIIIGPDGIVDTRVTTTMIPWADIANVDRIFAGKTSGWLTLHIAANDLLPSGQPAKTATNAAGAQETEVQIKGDLFDRRYSEIYKIAMAFYRAHHFGWLSSPTVDHLSEYQFETAPLFRKRLYPARPLPETGNLLPKAKAWRLRRGHDDKG